MARPDPNKPPLSPEDRQMHLNLALLSLAVLINVLGFSVIFPLVPDLMQRALNTGPNDPRLGEWGGWLNASYALMQFFFAPLWGSLSDRVGRKTILMGSLAGDVVFYTLFGLMTHSIAGMFAARILAGIFSSASLAVASASSADLTPPHLRAMGLGYLGAAFGVGFVFGPALGGLLGQFNLALPLFVSAGLALVNLIYIARFLPETRRVQDGPHPPAPSPNFGRGGAESPNLNPRPELGEGGPQGRVRAAPSRLTQMLRAVTGPVGFLYGLTFAVTFAFANLEGTFTVYLKQHFRSVHPVEVAGGVFAYIGVLIVLIQGGAIRPLVKRFGEANLVVVGVGLMAVGFLLFPLAPILPLLLIGPMVPIALGNGLNGPSLRALVSRKSAMTMQGATLGLSASFDSLARAAGPACGGYLYDHFGQAAPYWCAGIVMSVAFLLAVWKKNEMRADVAPPAENPVAAH